MPGYDRSSAVVLAKTDKGRAEIARRQYGLSQEQRSALILIDGRHAIGELIAGFDQWPALPMLLASLVEHGFVAPADSINGAPHTLGSASASSSSSSSSASPRSELVKLARSLLGKHAAAIVARIEQAEDTPNALQAVTDSCAKLVLLTIDEEKAQAFRSGAAAILARAA